MKFRHLILVLASTFTMYLAGTTTASASTISRPAIIHTAASLKGIPYRWGGSSPATGFDCSGYTRYVYARSGIALPRTANAQWRYVRHIPKSAARPGDLVFFLRSGRAYHVAIYAGGNRMWVAPRPGARVGLRVIWSASARYGKVL